MIVHAEIMEVVITVEKIDFMPQKVQQEIADAKLKEYEKGMVET